MNEFSNIQDECSLITSVEGVVFFFSFLFLSDLCEDDSIVYAHT